MPRTSAAHKPRPSAHDAHRSRLEEILDQLTHEPSTDPDAFLDAVEACAVANARALSRADAEGLRRAGISLEGHVDDPRGLRALVAGQSLVTDELDGALTVSETAARLGVSSSRVRQLIGGRHLLTVRHRDERVLPAWQFTDVSYLPGIPLLADAVSTMHPVALSRFMTHPNIDLRISGQAVTPAHWLALGGAVEPVAELLGSLAY